MGKQSNRPQSTMAKSFSLALNDLFKIDNCIADLDAAVSEKKKAVSTQTSELEALEARLKATEERLKMAATGSPPGKSSGRSSPRQRVPLGTHSKNTLQALCPQSSGTRMAEDMRQEIYPRLQDPAKMEMSRNRSDIDCCIIFRSTVTFWALHTLVG